MIHASVSLLIGLVPLLLLAIAVAVRPAPRRPVGRLFKSSL